MWKNNEKRNTALPGGFAVGEAFKQINPDVVAAYPITPQTPIIEYFAKKVANGEAKTEIVPVESEHSAMSACIGAAAAGARAMTASSSQGIMYMMEVLPVAASMRLPIVMAVANRAISGPINIHGDHSDAMAMRDTGWIQLFSENVQEAYLHTILAVKLAEKAQLPTAVNLDGFITSHSVENLELLNDEIVQEFVGEYQPKDYLLNFASPKTFGPVALPDSYFEFRHQLFEAMKAVPKTFREIAAKFHQVTGENFSAIEEYQTREAERIMVAMGSVCGTAKEAVDQAREQGEQVGLLKIRLFRPFPYEEVANALKNAKEVVVLDRNLTFGTQQVLAGEVSATLKNNKEKETILKSVVYGLGGRDVFVKDLLALFQGENKEFLW
jgi:pyruvate ferredoxin oxidoreductase alpha subunit